MRDVREMGQGNQALDQLHLRGGRRFVVLPVAVVDMLTLTFPLGHRTPSSDLTCIIIPHELGRSPMG
jgi:hypothetical protein